MRSEEQYADSGRYGSIAALLSSLDSCEGLNDSWGAGHNKADSDQCIRDGVLGDDEAITLLLKYTHVGGGGL